MGIISATFGLIFKILLIIPVLILIGIIALIFYIPYLLFTKGVSVVKYVIIRGIRFILSPFKLIMDIVRKFMKTIKDIMKLADVLEDGLSGVLDTIENAGKSAIKAITGIGIAIGEGVYEFGKDALQLLKDLGKTLLKEQKQH